MGIIQLLEDHGVEYTKGGKHATKGWVQIDCPLCSGNPGFHGGFNTIQVYYHCWRCGWHPLVEVLVELLSTSVQEVRKLIATYKLLDGESLDPYEADNEDTEMFKLPAAPIQIPQIATDYLASRGFTWEQIREWGVYATGFTGRYRLRLVAPISFGSHIVSFITRDVTGKAEAKYLPCPKEQEIMHHKHILYGMNRAPHKNIVVVEGVTDVWRLGPGAVATLGIDYSPKQLLCLAQKFENIAIMFDSEEIAQLKAAKLSMELEGLGRKSIVIKCSKDDPANLSREEAINVMENIPAFFEEWTGGE
ncbi:MAG: hypothetical protein ABIG39_06930 [Candidatus Micrarchaeota archaeon]